MDKQNTDIVAFFGTQLLTSVIGNLVANGLYDPNIARTNILETLDQGTAKFSEKHHRALVDLATVFRSAVARGESFLDQ